MTCPGVYPLDNKTVTDDEGNYQMEGVGIPDDCEIIFRHGDFAERKEIVNRNNAKIGPGSLAPVYILDDQVMP